MSDDTIALKNLADRFEDTEAASKRHPTTTERLSLLDAVDDALRTLRPLRSLLLADIEGAIGTGTTSVPDYGVVKVSKSPTRKDWDHALIRREAGRVLADTREVWANDDGEPHDSATIVVRVLEAFAGIVGSQSTYRVGDLRQKPPGPGLRTTLELDLANVCTEGDPSISIEVLTRSVDAPKDAA